MSLIKSILIQRVCISLTLFFSFLSTQALSQNAAQENSSGISERAQYELNRIKDPKLGKVPENAHWKALMEAKQASEFYLNTPARTTALSWIERGPNSDVVGSGNGNTRPNNGVTAGRIRAVLVDAADTSGKTVWIGGVDGGLWKTTDITAVPSPWTVINDYLNNLAVADICQDPSNSNTMYFCTGESYYNGDAVAGVGVFTSTDHGANWSLLSSTTAYTQCTRIVCDNAGNVYLATRGFGLLRSADGGATWTDITPTGMSNRICDLELSNTGRLHLVAGIFTTQSYRYTDNPSSVSSAAGWSAPVTPFPSYAMRAEIACLGNVLYALPANGSYQVPTIYKSTDGGANWAATAGQPASGWANGQGWYSLGIGIDPSNSNNCIVGGLDNYKTTNGGASWTKISNWVGTTGQYVHADVHNIAWYNNGNKLLIASDGGVFYSADKGTTIRDRNTGLRLKQFYSVAIHPTAGTNYFLAGAQDNGVHKLSSAGLGGSVEVTGGDGAFVAIDQNQPQYQFGSYVYNQYRRSTDGGSTWSSINISSSTGQFINPFDYDDVNNKIYAANTNGTYLRWDNPQTGSTTASVNVSNLNSGMISAVQVSPYTNNRVYFGTTAGRIVKVDNAHLSSPSSANLTSVSMPSGANVSCISSGTSDKNLIACFSNYGVMNIWLSVDSGATWTGIDGDLPDMPVNWCMFEPNDDSRAIIATETGVWETTLLNGSATAWIPSLNFPSVCTLMLQYRSSDATLVAATHGRGIFTTVLEQTSTCNTPVGLTTSSITSSSASLSWTTVSNAISYNADYRINGDTIWINAATATTSTTVNLTGLSSVTLYEWRVSTNCSAASSNYSSAQFTTSTIPSCNAPTGLNASTITATGATVNWTAVSGALNYTVDYKLTSAGSWTNAASANTSTSYTLTGLTSSSTYDYRVMTNCSGSSSSYTQAQFTTGAASSCPGAYDISTNGVYSGAAVIPNNTDIKGLININGDIDFYKFVVTTAGTATITLSTLPANYDLRLYSGNGTTSIASSTNNGTTSETITHTYTAGTYYIKVYPGHNNTFNATNCYTLRIQMGTATQQDLLIPMSNENTVVKLYPNPANNTLNISTDRVLDGNSFLQIFSITGVELIHQSFSSNPQSIDLSPLKPGIYFIKAHTSEGDGIYKFVRR